MAVDGLINALKVVDLLRPTNGWLNNRGQWQCIGCTVLPGGGACDPASVPPLSVHAVECPVRGAIWAIDHAVALSPLGVPGSRMKCPKCLGSKLIQHQIGKPPGDAGCTLCPCIKVGDVIPDLVLDLLPRWSRVQGKDWGHDSGAYWEKTEPGWDGVAGGDTEPTAWNATLKGGEWRIIRLGPGPDKAGRS